MFLKCFCRYLKAAKCKNMQNCKKRKSKTKGRLTMKYGIDVEYT